LIEVTEIINFDATKPQTPCYVVDEKLVRANLEKLRGVMDAASCKILLAQKAFSGYWLYPLIGQYLSGTTASGLYEARLGWEEMAGKPVVSTSREATARPPQPLTETHVFSAAYTEAEYNELVTFCDYIIFNSFTQWVKFGSAKTTYPQTPPKFGIRINPEHSTQGSAFGGTASYDPCSPGSRLGVRATDFEAFAKAHGLDGISGLHFHTLCEQNSDDLKTTLDAVEEKFGKWLWQMEWLNFGGGHHITRKDYDVQLLIDCIKHFKQKYNVEVYLEPGEAVVLNAGFMITTVLDIVENSGSILVLDASAACHAPDIIEAPYRAPITGAVANGALIPAAGEANEKPYTYRLTGPTCLAGDIFGEYSFDKPLNIGDRIIFGDMAHYSMVKNNTFNAMPLPSIYSAKANGSVGLVKSFGYNDFKNRL